MKRTIELSAASIETQPAVRIELKQDGVTKTIFLVEEGFEFAILDLVINNWLFI